ncbi:DUF31 family putative serine protease [[Mycoplasma] testudinis]|uniref:DUF31 family putative serine protease n=1 Tax=[Mycoplasma] testudinis TaxID=33924 RepID=UPI0004860DF8|nr:hypothetical protein [[Mycoplasma] testudinis]
MPKFKQTKKHPKKYWWLSFSGLSALAFVVSACASTSTSSELQPSPIQSESNDNVNSKPNTDSTKQPVKPDPVEPAGPTQPTTPSDPENPPKQPEKPGAGEQSPKEPSNPNPEKPDPKSEEKTVVFPEQLALTVNSQDPSVLPSSIIGTNYSQYVEINYQTQEFKPINVQISNQDDNTGNWTLTFNLQDIASKKISSTTYRFNFSDFLTTQAYLNQINNLDFNAADTTTRPDQVTNDNFLQKVTIDNLPEGVTFHIVTDSLNPDQKTGILKFKYTLEKQGETSVQKDGSVNNLKALSPFNPIINFNQDSISKLIADREFASEVRPSDLEDTLTYTETTNPKPPADEQVNQIIYSDLTFNNAKRSITFKYKLRNSFNAETNLQTKTITGFKNVLPFLQKITVTPAITELGSETYIPENQSFISPSNSHLYFDLAGSDPRIRVSFLGINQTSNYSKNGEVSITANISLQSDTSRDFVRRTMSKILLTGFNPSSDTPNPTISFTNTIAENNVRPANNMFPYFQVGQSPTAQGHLTTNVDLKNNAQDKKAFDFMANRVVALHVNFDANKQLGIQGEPNIQSVGGTGWLIGKASSTDDPYDPNFYSYYVGTNLHVYTAFLQRQLDQSIIDYSWSANKQYNHPEQFMLQRNPQGQWDDTQTALTRSDYAKGDIDYVYSATNLTAKVDHWTKNQAGEITNDSNVTDNVTININNQPTSVKLAIDFAVMKVNFLSPELKASLKQAKDAKIPVATWAQQLVSKSQATSGHNENQIRTWNAAFIQHLTTNTLANFPDLQFAKTTYNPTDGFDHTSTDLQLLGYTAGYPASLGDDNGTAKEELYIGQNRGQIGSGFMFTKVNKIDQMLQHGTLTDSVVNGNIRRDTTQPLDFYPNGANSKPGDISTHVQNISVTKSVQYLNVSGGSSGSPFLSTNNPDVVLGIYRGVYSDTPNPQAQNFFGQIVQLRVNGYYDVIGGATPMANTPANNTLYSALEKLHNEHPEEYRILNLK